ncbi:hypothetical protein BDV23DRAFT_181604 [Aspergillus alliaceus]|uniref:Hydantoinase B/oxoprolinase domain-containing protein n=1 Tax=Petromyces alliaceus TaxID=209559 RepID=A0A5N7CE81_PETAA|nr:hypothetical protein BDV23DRAFT_181604 [Aspergillus alliaceus]
MEVARGINISVDRGETFCDVLVQLPGKAEFDFKLLTEDPQNCRDAPAEAIWRALEITNGREIPRGRKIDGSRIASWRVVDSGKFLEDGVQQAFLDAGNLPGCSRTPCLNDNFSNIKAQISSKQRGTILLQKLYREFTLPVIHRYMHAIQANAGIAVRKYFKGTARTRDMPLTATDYFDNGTILKVSIINR